MMNIIILAIVLISNIDSEMNFHHLIHETNELLLSHINVLKRHMWKSKKYKKKLYKRWKLSICVHHHHHHHHICNYYCHYYNHHHHFCGYVNIHTQTHTDRDIKFAYLYCNNNDNNNDNNGSTEQQQQQTTNNNNKQQKEI